jgi:hypothetical protein
MGILNLFKHRASNTVVDERPPAMVHYLHFPDKEIAEEAGMLLRDRNFDVDVEPGDDEKNWLVLVTHELADWRGKRTSPPDYFGAIASHFDGGYDGWEIGPYRQAS